MVQKAKKCIPDSAELLHNKSIKQKYPRRNGRWGRKKKEVIRTACLQAKFFAWKSRDVALGCNVIVLGYLTIFCTDGLGLPATLVGTLLLFSKIFDGVTDLFAGYIVDNTRTRFGKGRPYELSILGVWLMTIIMFFCPPSMSTAVKAVWVFITYTFINSIFTTLLNACQTPYMIRAFGSQQSYCQSLLLRRNRIHLGLRRGIHFLSQSHGSPCNLRHRLEKSDSDLCPAPHADRNPPLPVCKRRIRCRCRRKTGTH